MKKIFCHLICTFLFMSLFAQKEKFDIATFTPPKGWQRIDSNGMIAFLDEKTSNGQTTFCQIFLYPSQPGSGKASRDFESEWANHVVKSTGTNEIPKTQTEKAGGWDVTTGYTNINHLGVTFTCMLVTASGFGRKISILVNVAGQDYMAAVQKFLNDYDLDSNAANAPVSPSGANDYSFLAPEGWHAQKASNSISLSNSSDGEAGCFLTILSPQPSSGNLEKEAWEIFNQLYAGWQFRNTGKEKEDVTKGYTLQGLEFCMIEAAMQKSRTDGACCDYEKGQVLVIGFGNQKVVICRTS